MINLRADNRILVSNTFESFLQDNYPSNSSTLTIVNREGFNPNDFILVGEFGQETAEIFRIGAITSGGVITLQTPGGASTTTRFAHAESTKVYVLPYDEVRFFWTAATGTIDDENPEFNTANPLSSWMSITPDSHYTIHGDNSNSTGFGWFVFRNSISEEASQNSNAIPYIGFDENTVASIFADFDSLLNINEIKLVTMGDKFAWLNEAVALVRSRLNMTNTEYFVSVPVELIIVGGTAEYLLPNDFSDLIEITDTSTYRRPIPFLSVHQIMKYNGNEPHYYLRNRYIGFVPTPTEGTVYQYRYRSKSSRVTNLSTYIDLPDNAFYSLKDFMMYRACLKFNNPLAETYYESFTNAVNLSTQSAVKRDAHLDTWGFDPHIYR